MDKSTNRKKTLTYALLALGLVATFLLGIFVYPMIYKTSQTEVSAFAPSEWNGKTKYFVMSTMHGQQEIADGVLQDVWTFNGTVPGPVVRATAGDKVHITLTNDSPMLHSIDFHASVMAWNTGMRDIAPDESMEIEFVAKYPGVFLYHCGTAPVLMHIGMGMYGAIVVEPVEPRPAAKEIVFVQSEFYNNYEEMKARNSSYVVFNGKAFQYKNNPIEVKKDELIRVYVVDAGPQFVSNFHVVGTVFDVVYPDGNTYNRLVGLEAYTIPAGGAAVFEFRLGEAGLNPFVTHSFADATQGAVGLFKVVAA